MNCIEIGGKQVVRHHDARNVCEGCAFLQKGGYSSCTLPKDHSTRTCYEGSFIYVEVNHNSTEVK